MGRQPGIVFLVDTIVVEDDVNLLVVGQTGYHLIHESQELCAALLMCCLGMDGPRGNLQSCKEIQGSVALVSALEAMDNFPIVRFHIACGTLQCLDARLFVNGYDQCILRGVQLPRLPERQQIQDSLDPNCRAKEQENGSCLQ